MRLPFLWIRLRVLAAAAVVVSASGSAASAITIDDFSVGSIEVARTGSTAASAQQTGLDPLHVLGGSRDFSVGTAGGSGQRLVVDAPAGELRFDTDTTGYFRVTYGSLTEPLNINLTADGSNAFLFHITYAVPNSPLSLIPGNTFRVITTSGTRFGSMTVASANIATQPDGSRLIRLPFSSLNGQGDLKMVERIEYELFRVPPGSHFTLRTFATVPEPSTGILSILAGLAYSRRTLRRFRA
jgi:hypothetical protein